MKNRLQYLDWLRIIAIGSIVFYHVILIFTPLQGDAGLITNNEQSTILTAISLVIPLLALAILFFVSGMSTQLALKNRTKIEYLKNRLKRLTMPFMIGIITIVPFQYYFSSIHKSTTYTFIQGFVWSPKLFVLYGSHLWFFAYLFIFSLVALPISYKKFPKYIYQRGSILIFILPLFLIQTILRIHFPTFFGWADFTFWLLLFIMGGILSSDKDIMKYVKRDWKLCLAAGIVSILGIVSLYFINFLNAWLNEPKFSLLFLLMTLLYSTFTWSFLIVTLYLSKLFLSIPLSKETREAGLPIYILHQPIIVFVAFYVVQTTFSLFTKLMMILVGAFVLLIITYVIIKKINVIRVMFGMKRKELSK
jgi:glucans biosynthesis protein C